MQEAQEDIVREMRKAVAEGLDDELDERAAISYDLSTDETVNMGQSKRIVQKMKLHL